MELSDDAQKWLEVLRNAKTNRDQWDELSKEARQALLTELDAMSLEDGDEVVGTIAGEPVVTVKRGERSQFNMKQFKVDFPKIHREYSETKVTTYTVNTLGDDE